MNDDSAICPQCGKKIELWFDDIEDESFGDFDITQTYRLDCPDCGTKFRVTDHFKLTDTTYELV